MTDPFTTLDRFRGCLVLGAVGDALGAPVEFAGIGDIRRRHGPGGVTGHTASPPLATDDTQMALFTVEGLIRASVRRRSGDVTDEAGVVWHAYLRWLHTQGVPWSTARAPDGWLVEEGALHHRRAPGNTCLSALRGGRPGAVDAPVNDSKGCGGVMRAAPAGLYLDDPVAAFDLGCTVAALTHGHPSGFHPAGALAAMVAEGRRDGVDVEDAVDRGRVVLLGKPGADETIRALDRAVALAGKGGPSPEQLEGLGGAWVGEEALAIAVCCALAFDDPREALLASVNHSGDSDSTGAICGNLVGAVRGTSAIPPGWADDVDLGPLALQLADDLWTELVDPPSAGDHEVASWWRARYPGW